MDVTCTMTSLLIVTSLMVVIGSHVASGVPMTATIDMEGITGTVTFTRDSTNSADAHVVESLSGTNSDQYDTSDLHTFPAVFGRTKTATQVCATSLGAKIRNLFTSASLDTLITNFNETEYYHRSVLLSSTTNTSLPRICATVLPDQVTTHRVKFMGPAVGTVWLRRHDDVGTFIFGDLSYTDGRAAGSQRDLVVYSDGILNFTAPFSEFCSQLATPHTIASGINVASSVSEEGRFAHLTDVISNSLLQGSSLALVKNTAIESCNFIRPVVEKTLVTVLDWNGVDGHVTFVSKSPFDKTVTTVSLRGLQNAASGFHVHKFPVPQRLSADENPCAAQHVSGHFNPYKVDVNLSPAAGTGTNDQYEIGDLSGKYGTLDGFAEIELTSDDWNLPLWGPNSIFGRSVVIHRTDGSRMLCGTIGSSEPLNTAIAVFKAPVYGTMYFRQHYVNADDETSVFVELASQDKRETTGHNWHVHMYPVEDDAFTSTGRCSSAGPHYNPSAINVTDPPYKSECALEDPLRCELGDLSGRLGRLNIATTLRTEGGKFFFVDEYLHLLGDFSIIGRSVVVHVPSAGAGRFACANITQLWPTVVKTGKWMGTEGAAEGTLTLKQHIEFEPTKVTGSFSGLASLASGYHIHEFTISETAEAGKECEAASVAGHYNPFNWTDTTPALTGTYDQYEVGDLSNKYGLLDGRPTYTLANNLSDTNLPLFTYLGSGDKSLVIHKKEGGARWKCTNIYTEAEQTSNGFPISASGHFDTVVTGIIKLRQIVYQDGGATLTNYDLEVSPISGSASLQHNWHVHIDPVTKENECDVALGHYDPYDAITNTNYATDCNKKNPLFCEVGDISGKQGRYDIGGGRKTFQDVDTPLHTNFTVLGRSIVFHEANGAAPRHACANILPDDYSYTLAFSPLTEFNRFWFTKTVADALGISRLRVVIIHNYDVPLVRGGCSRVMVHIVGGSSVPGDKLKKLLDGSIAGLGSYAPTTNCKNEEGLEYHGQRSGSASSYLVAKMVVFLSFVVTALATKLD